MRLCAGVLLWTTALVVPLSACAGARDPPLAATPELSQDAAPPKPPPSSWSTTVVSPAAASGAATAPAPKISTDRASLNLADVIELVAAQNLDLQATRKGVDAVAARQIDAGALTNPEASIFSEDLGGGGSRRGLSNTQTTLELSQAIPLADRLRQQRAVARGEYGVAEREYDARRVAIFAEVTRIFIALLVAQQRAALVKEQFGLVGQLARVQEAEVTAGQVAPFERSRAIAALAEARLRVNEASRDLRVLQQRLASFWSADAASLPEITGDLERLPPIPALPTLRAKLESSPEIERSTAEIELRRSAMALERSKAVPDLTVKGGVRRHEDEDNYAFVVGLSIPLRIFSRNQSGIVEANQREIQAELQLQSAQTRLTATLNVNYEKLTSGAAEIETLRNTLIPSSAQAIAALREGYRLRKFPLSELLIAEQSLNALRDKLLTALGAYHETYAETEQLLGGSLEAQPPLKPR